jgi:hypothetical protein
MPDAVASGSSQQALCLPAAALQARQSSPILHAGRAPSAACVIPLDAQECGKQNVATAHFCPCIRHECRTSHASRRTIQSCNRYAGALARKSQRRTMGCGSYNVRAQQLDMCRVVQRPCRMDSSIRHVNGSLEGQERSADMFPVRTCPVRLVARARFGVATSEQGTRLGLQERQRRSDRERGYAGIRRAGIVRPRAG